MSMNEELGLLAEADRRAAAYLSSVDGRRVFPDDEAIAALARFEEPLPSRGRDAHETLAMLDEISSPATTASNGPRYFGFVVWQGRPAFRLSVCSWRTRDEDIGRAVDVLARLRRW
jgi:hypothetical protein